MKLGGMELGAHHLARGSGHSAVGRRQAGTVVGQVALVIVQAATVLLLGAVAVQAQVVRGVVAERGTYEPVDLATVLLVDADLDTLDQVITDDRGYFSFDLPDSGEYSLIASALGYQAIRSESVWVGAGEVRVVEVAMDPRPVPVEGLVVEARFDEPRVAGLVPTGFYERMAEGRGEYLTPGQIQGSEVRWPQQLFWGMRTVRVHQRSHERPGVWNDILVIPNRTGPGYCRPSIYIDGRWLRYDMMGEGESLADIIYKDELLGVEVYQWPFGVPWQYTGNQSCGVILFWTDNEA